MRFRSCLQRFFARKVLSKFKQLGNWYFLDKRKRRALESHNEPSKELFVNFRIRFTYEQAIRIDFPNLCNAIRQKVSIIMHGIHFLTACSEKFGLVESAAQNLNIASWLVVLDDRCHGRRGNAG